MLTFLDDEVDIILHIHANVFGAELGQRRLHSTRTLGTKKHTLPGCLTCSRRCSAWTYA